WPVVVWHMQAVGAGFGRGRRGPRAGVRRPPRRTRPSRPPLVYAAPPEHVDALPPGFRLPAGSECAALIRTRPLPENKAVNAAFNQARGHALARDFFDPRSGDPRANATISVRVDGDFAGTTHEI